MVALDAVLIPQPELGWVFLPQVLFAEIGGLLLTVFGSYGHRGF